MRWEGAAYVWYIAPDQDFPLEVLHVAAEDKGLILACPMGWTPAYVISKGQRFQGRKTNGCWNRYRLPCPLPRAVTPAFVAALVSWAERGTGAEKVLWDGAVFPL